MWGCGYSSVSLKAVAWGGSLSIILVQTNDKVWLRSICRLVIVSVALPSNHTSQPKPHAPSAGFSQLSSTNLTSCFCVSMPKAFKLLRYSSWGLPGSGFRITCSRDYWVSSSDCVRNNHWDHSQQAAGRFIPPGSRLSCFACEARANWRNDESSSEDTHEVNEVMKMLCQCKTCIWVCCCSLFGFSPYLLSSGLTEGST